MAGGGGGAPERWWAPIMGSTRRARSVGIETSSSIMAPAGAERDRASSVSGSRRGPTVRTAPCGRPPTREAWNCMSRPWPRRAWARPGIDGGMCAEAEDSTTSWESDSSVTRSAMRRFVLDLISADTTPAGRWVARTRCTPRERPRRAMSTRPVTNWGSSATSAANSSMMSIRRGMGSSPGPMAAT